MRISSKRRIRVLRHLQSTSLSHVVILDKNGNSIEEVKTRVDEVCENKLFFKSNPFKQDNQ